MICGPMEIDSPYYKKYICKTCGENVKDMCTVHTRSSSTLSVRGTARRMASPAQGFYRDAIWPCKENRYERM